ncbi:5-formyltetrahydrofolate cyclo-ligase [Bifidobacterium cuniculi]|uniref:5-formyltetrahydrofolate cyclo-ligase n=1 Tax=Bifidobacterium cuniculi TaxID=1688 RepID=A0A087AY99_9BIFI|nr:5-formyltetrahydrofolate cyclo-ligase [Bifidobacterium cuniculi]KFI63749.1 5-formyltetrahydrofolate cyclo-ligase [Bifidobacterium cuniculi]
MSSDTSSPEPAETAAASKRVLRHAAYPLRRAKEAAERLRAGEACTRLLRAQPAYVRAADIACYVSMGTEVSTTPLLAAMLADGKRVLVPRLGSGMEIGWSALEGEGALDALRAVDSPHLRPDEPDLPVLGPEALADCTLVVLPALAVDGRGIRLGRGGGWYDRALRWRAPEAELVALVWPWEFDARRDLPHGAHDVPVDAVLTPDAFIGLGDDKS